MLYKFKSKAGADVIMLEPTGRQVLGIIGKGPQAQGILLPEQMLAAKAALQAAIAQDEQAAADAEDEDEDTVRQRISLRTRAWPLVSLIERSLKEETPITWGV
ncbi:DUF1840 domain-containing protein [Variovorax sp. PCZ-1]|uniref:DUF1840 domain-containing protein n=1 Tax=Variovorax sp. PCZ-1 TaxID=2835533 RepID=UPI001BCB8F0D|nr:DUF1840 domain-containing protein [Variovorax sp. PCZ-1]MBS7809078.1 DUF1840 domain-containing protein [Variovorax sp. PCZ-1]